MRVWVDADACPAPIKDIVLRAVKRSNVEAVFVANKPINLPSSPTISFVLVKSGPDEADAYIVENSGAGDIAITQDIPLAAQLVPKGLAVMSPRGDAFTEDNIGDRLSSRDLMSELRDTGEVTGGPRPFDDKVKRQFANVFDAALSRMLRRKKVNQTGDKS